MSLHCRKANSQQGEASAAEPMKPRAKAVQKKQQPRWQGTRLPIVTFEVGMMIENAQRAEWQLSGNVNVWWHLSACPRAPRRRCPHCCNTVE